MSSFISSRPGHHWKLEAKASSQVMILPEWMAARPMMSARFESAARSASLWGRSLRMAAMRLFHSACQGVNGSSGAVQSMLSLSHR